MFLKSIPSLIYFTLLKMKIITTIFCQNVFLFCSGWEFFARISRNLPSAASARFCTPFHGYGLLSVSRTFRSVHTPCRYNAHPSSSEETESYPTPAANSPQLVRRIPTIFAARCSCTSRAEWPGLLGVFRRLSGVEHRQVGRNGTSGLSSPEGTYSCGRREQQF